MRFVTMMLAATLALSACNTMQGVGRDVQGAGNAIENSAEQAQQAVTN